MILASEDIGEADPTRAADRGGRRAGDPVGRPAGGGDHPGPGRDPPGDGAEVQRGDRGARRGAGGRAGRARRPGAGAPARRALRRRQAVGARPRLPRTPHDFPGGVVRQQYAPDPVVGRDYYAPDRPRRRTGCRRAGRPAAFDPARHPAPGPGRPPDRERVGDRWRRARGRGRRGRPAGGRPAGRPAWPPPTGGGHGATRRCPRTRTGRSSATRLRTGPIRTGGPAGRMGRSVGSDIAGERART